MVYKKCRRSHTAVCLKLKHMGTRFKNKSSCLITFNIQLWWQHYNSARRAEARTKTFTSNSSTKRNKRGKNILKIVTKADKVIAIQEL
jgi:hypothetical protein